jgi:ribonuclease J
MTSFDGFQWLSLGGVGEIGKNCYVLDIEGKLIVIDAGMAFPDMRMFGVDIVIPDFSYLIKHQQRIKAIILTHGHEDHIGSLAYLLQDLKQPPPIYGSKFTLGLVRSKLAEFNLGMTKLTEFKPGDDFEVAGIKIQTIRVTHSIPDACSLAITTPAGIYVHSGDFKLDPTPVDGKTTDIDKLRRIGEEGVTLLSLDVTNIERTGHSGSESTIRPALHDYVAGHPGRVFVTTFASNIHRVQQAIDVAVELQRKVLILGRTMLDNVEMSQDLGYLKVPPNVLVDPFEAEKLKPHRLMVVLTGSQGEPLSAAARLASGDHRFVTVQEDDLFIFSARPIPGNEVAILSVIDDLFRLGAEVIYGIDSGVHVSGHSYQEEIREYLNLVQPQYIIPNHGQYRHQMRFRKLAQLWGLPHDGVTIVQIGQRFGVSEGGLVLDDEIKAGEVFIAANGGTDLNRRILNERLALAEDGLLVFSIVLSPDGSEIVSPPQLVGKGFLPEKEAPELFRQIEQAVRDAVLRNRQREPQFQLQLRNNVQNTIQKVIFEQTKINPVVIGMVSYVGEDMASWVDE